MEARIALQLLRHTAYYIIVDSEGKDAHIQFRAEIGMSSFFKVPVARFIWPDKSVYEVSVEPFTAKHLFKSTKTDPETGKPIVGTEMPPFEVKYSNGAWYAPLRPRP